MHSHPAVVDRQPRNGRARVNLQIAGQELGNPPHSSESHIAWPAIPGAEPLAHHACRSGRFKQFRHRLGQDSEVLRTLIESGIPDRLGRHKSADGPALIHQYRPEAALA